MMKVNIVEGKNRVEKMDFWPLSMKHEYYTEQNSSYDPTYVNKNPSKNIYLLKTRATIVSWLVSGLQHCFSNIAKLNHMYVENPYITVFLSHSHLLPSSLIVSFSIMFIGPSHQKEFNIFWISSPKVVGKRNELIKY